MKKILLALLFLATGSLKAATLSEQVSATLLTHGTVFEQYQAGQKEMVVMDNVIEMGKLDKAYVGAFALALTNDLHVETLFKLNVHSVVNRYVTYTPQWDWLKSVEYFPAVGYDWNKGRDHAWVASVNLGIGFGPGSGVPSNDVPSNGVPSNGVPNQ